MDITGSERRCLCTDFHLYCSDFYYEGKEPDRMSHLSDSSGYRLSEEGTEQLIQLRESHLAFNLPEGYRSNLERDPEKALEKLQSTGFVLPKKN